MKIAYLAGNVDESSGGLRSTILPLAKEIARCGQDVHVLCNTAVNVSSAGRNPAHLLTFRSTGPRQFGFMPGMRKILASISADIVHAHGLWMYPSIVATLWGRQNSGPRMVSPHGMLNDFALDISQRKKALALSLYEMRHLRDADCIHALNEAELRAIRDFGLSNPVCVIGNGVSVPPNDMVHRSPPWDESWQGKRNVMLYLGRLHHIKGVDELINSWHQLCIEKVTEDWVLVIAGGGTEDYQSKLRNLVNRLGLENSVVFIGSQFGDNKAACFMNSDAFVLPSNSEGFPVTILEAWSYKLPVAMTRACNVPEGFEDGAAIEILTAELGADGGLRELVEMRSEDRENMGRRGYRLVNKDFLWSKIGSNMLAVYLWLTASGPKPDCVDIV